MQIDLLFVVSGRYEFVMSRLALSHLILAVAKVMQRVLFGYQDRSKNIFC